MKVTEEEIINFVGIGNFEIHFFENTFMSIGLKWGESKRLKPYFSRTKQIKLLNHIQDNFILYRDLLLNESNEVLK